MNKKNINKQLNSPEVPKALESKIFNNWQSQVKQQENSQKYSRKKGLAAIAASFLIAVIIWGKIPLTPTVVYAALDDIVSDEKQDIGLSVSLQTIAAIIDRPVSFNQLPIRMSKYCTLNQAKMLHVKISNEQRREVHLFVNQDTFNIASWQSSVGNEDGMNWEIISPKENLNILVIHSNDINDIEVNALIQQIFYT